MSQGRGRGRINTDTEHPDLKRAAQRSADDDHPPAQQPRAHSPQFRDVTPPSSISSLEPMQLSQNRDINREVPVFKNTQSVETGVLSKLAASMSSPYPTRDILFVLVETIEYAPYFESLYLAMVDVLYPGDDLPPANMITQINFVLVCRYLMKSRIDVINARISGIRRMYRIAIPNAFPIPAALGYIINGIGTFMINSGAALICPSPEPNIQDINLNLVNLVNGNTLTQFASLVNACKSRAFVRTVYIDNVEGGTAYWYLAAINGTTNLLAQGNATTAYVQSTFVEFTPRDAVLACIAQNRQDGLDAFGAGYQWRSDVVRGIQALRNEFNLHA